MKTRVVKSKVVKPVVVPEPTPLPKLDPQSSEFYAGAITGRLRGPPIEILMNRNTFEAIVAQVRRYPDPRMPEGLNMFGINVRVDELIPDGTFALLNLVVAPGGAASVIETISNLISGFNRSTIGHTNIGVTNPCAEVSLEDGITNMGGAIVRGMRENLLRPATRYNDSGTVSRWFSLLGEELSHMSAPASFTRALRGALEPSMRHNVGLSLPDTAPREQPALENRANSCHNCIFNRGAGGAGTVLCGNRGGAQVANQRCGSYRDNHNQRGRRGRPR